MLFILKEGLADLRRASFSTFFSTFVIFLSLMVVNLYFYLSASIDETMQDLKKNFVIELFIADSTSQFTIDRLTAQLNKSTVIASVRLISKEQAKEIFRKEFDDDPESTIGYNPLPRSLQLVLKKQYITDKRISALVNSCKKQSMITDVIYDTNVSKLEYRKFGRKFGYPVIAFISLVSLFLVFNTIRLTIRHKQEIIKTMKLVGASNFTIRTPFLISGCLQGLFGSLLAVFFTRILIKLINQYLVGDLIHLQTEISLLITLKIILFGAFLGIAGSWLSVSRYLSRY